jgi:transcriptional regulator with XRE-family HTH domain
MKTEPLLISRIIAERIRQLRRDKDYSQQFMADAIGISQNAYSKLESGKTPIHLDRLVQVAALLDINVCALLEETLERAVH